MKILITGAGVILSAAVIILGFFQIQSVLRTGELTEESFRKNLNVALYHTGQELFEGEQQLISLLSSIRPEPDGQELDKLLEVLSAWFEENEEGHLIQAVYLGIEGAGLAFRYDASERELQRAERIPDGIFNIPFRKPGPGVDIFLDIDKDALYGLKLPAILREMDDEYGWRITGRDGEVITESNMTGITYPPEFYIELGDRFVLLFGDLRGFQTFLKREIRSDDDAAQDDVVLSENRIPEQPDEDAAHWGRLEIYFAGGPLNSIVRRQVVLHLTASSTALLLIVAGFLLLYRLYRHSEAQRQQEQEFVSTISHELRTPLAVLSTAGENISRGIVKAERIGAYGKMITRESRRLEAMIEGILYYSGLQRGSDKLRINEEVDLARMLSEIRERYSLKAEEMDVRVNLEIPAEFPRIRAGREGISLVIGNLILNGLVHAYPPGFHVKPEDRILTVRVDIREKNLVIEIEDRGCGIPHKEQKRIFGAFIRGETSRRSQIPGSGLGLHIARRAAELSGGRLELKSTGSPAAGTSGGGDSGSLFSVTIPVEIVEVKDE